MSNIISDKPLKAFNVRLDLTQEQKDYLSKVFGAYRFAYNHYKSERDIFWDDRIRNHHMNRAAKWRVLQYFYPTDPYKLRGNYSCLKSMPIEIIIAAKEACDSDYNTYYKTFLSHGAHNKLKPPKAKELSPYQSMTIRTRYSKFLDYEKRTITYPGIGELMFDNSGNAYAETAQEFENAKPVLMTLTRKTKDEFWCKVLVSTEEQEE